MVAKVAEQGPTKVAIMAKVAEQGPTEPAPIAGTALWGVGQQVLAPRRAKEISRSRFGGPLPKATFAFLPCSCGGPLSEAPPSPRGPLAGRRRRRRRRGDDALEQHREQALPL